MKKLIALALFVAAAATVMGCETMKGAGKDIEHGGEAIQQAAA